MSQTSIPRLPAINLPWSASEKIGVYTNRGGRFTNEDSYGWTYDEDNNTGLLCVCDGIGGASYGDILSRVCAGLLIDAWESLQTSDSSLSVRLGLAIRQTDIFSSRLTSYLGGDSGTTLIALAYSDDEVTIASVGDSHAYLLQDGAMTNPLVESGRVCDESSQLKSAIGYSLVANDEISVQSWTLDNPDTMRVLLCSDGVWGALDASAMQELLSGAADLDLCAQELVERSVAVKGERSDNATALIFDYSPAVERTAQVNW